MSKTIELSPSLTIEKLRNADRYLVRHRCPGTACGGDWVSGYVDGVNRFVATGNAIGQATRKCYRCAEADKPVEQRIEEHVDEILTRTLKQRRSYLRSDLEKAIKAAQEEIDSMEANPEYVPFTHTRTNWVRHYAEKAEAYGKEVDALYTEVKVLRQFFPMKGDQ